jgi:tRNA(Ile)-lysidine synthase
MLDDLADEDLRALQGDDGLSLAGLLRLSSRRQRNLLRHWCASCNLPLPAQVHLQQIQRQMTAPPDQVPVIRWPGAELRRYQGRLYLMPPLPSVDMGISLDWDLEHELELPLGQLAARMDCRDGLSGRIRRQRVQVRFRAGGERIVTESGHHRPLKKLFQEYRVLPWWRGRLPLVYVDGELAAVADIVIDERFRAQQGELAICLEWRKY